MMSMTNMVMADNRRTYFVFKNSINSKIAAAAIAGVLVIGFGGGAVAGSLVTSQDIKNGTIKAKDLKPPS